MPYNADIMTEIVADAQRYRVPADYFNRLIATESSYNTNAYNAKYGAAGIAQMLPSTAKQYGIDPYNYKQALPAAAQLLRSFYDKDPTAGWLAAVGAYKGKSGDANTRRAYAESVFANDKIKVYDLPDVTLAGNGKIAVTDSYKLDDMWTSLGQAPIFKAAGWFQQDKIDPKTGEKIKVDAQTGEPATGSFSNMIVNYSLVGLGAVFVITAGVRLSL